MGLHRGFNEIEVNNGGGGMYGAYPRFNLQSKYFKSIQ